MTDEFTLRRCTDGDIDTIFAIINDAAEAYRGVIPGDCWHEPYMSMTELRREIDSGVVFWGCDIDGELVAVMGIQSVKDVELIRHAYVRPGRQRGGIGARLLHHLREQTRGPILIGTWRDATWALEFYKRNGFALINPEKTQDLLGRYWSIPDRQAELSVVLASQPLDF